VVTLKNLIAALCVAGSFEPLGFWFLAPIGYALWIHSLVRDHHHVRNTLIFGFISNALILQWSGVYVGALPWLALSLLQSIYLIPVAMISRRISGKHSSRVGFIIFLVLLSEEVRARFPFGGFGWTRIAFSQINSPFASLASLGGVALVSFASLLLSWLLISRNRIQAFAALALLVISVLTPHISFAKIDNSTNQTIRIRAVQGGTPSVGFDFNSRALGVLKMHIEQSLKDFKTTDELIVWPENAIDIDPTKNAEVAALITSFTTKIDRPLLAGAIISTSSGPKNAVIYFDEKGKIQAIYEKRYLTPFGEYIPLRNLAEFLSPYADQVNDFIPGKKQTIFEINGFTASSVICYEIINDGLVRDSSNSSNLLFVHTNSATFANTSEGDQQLAITRFRAVEHQRSILSVSTTGPSGFIDDGGEVQAYLADGERGSIEVEFRGEDRRSLSSMLGGVTNIATLSAALLLALVGTRKRRMLWLRQN
jgi:apolipoprotein N-acyltransferase